MVSGYAEIVSLLHDPRISSDQSKREGGRLGGGQMQPGFINTDPPEHDRLRRETTSFFGPPHRPDMVAALEPWMHETVNRLIDDFADRKQIDVVDDFAYPFPVSAICRILGVPPEDEPRFRGWSSALIVALGLRFHPEGQQEAFQAALKANQEMTDYLGALAEAHAKDPGDDILSGLATDKGPDAMDIDSIKSTARMLLIAGHETTVNLISNGTLTLLRHPEHIERVRNEPEYVIRLVEELLRFEPPVQMVPNRTAMEDIAVGETTIPAGAPDHARACGRQPRPPPLRRSRHVRSRSPGRHRGPAPRVGRRYPLLLRRAAGPARGPDRAGHAVPPARQPAPRAGPAALPAEPDPARPRPPPDRDGRGASG